MKANMLSLLSMPKYERLLPRVFPGAVKLEIRDRQNELFWSFCPIDSTESDAEAATDNDPVVAWSAFGPGIERRQMPAGQLQFRAALLSRARGKIAWLVAAYDTQPSVPMSTAPEPLRRAFADATAFLQEEIELQSECDELAHELTERYEELNLVYATKDQVEYFEEGQEALTQLVHNCVDYLDVDFAALICRDRGLVLHDANRKESPAETEAVLDILSTTIYDRVESQVQGIVINDTDDEERKRLFAARDDNVLAFPIIDDYGTAIGLLAVTVRRDVHTFSNGDRNLLEVMAKKAGRIIHTHHDSLTGLINRSGFESTLVATLAATRSKNLQHCLIHIDLDQLHVVNDLMGFQEGDNLIRRVAKLLRVALRDSDYLARLGSDEFAVLLANCDTNRGYKIAEKIRHAIHDLKVVSANRQLDVSASFGLAMITAQTEGIMAAMAAAEIACKSAKEGGKDRIQVYAEDNTTLVKRSEEIEWVSRVQDALRDDLFVLYCQPVIALKNDDLPPHFEILVRMLDDAGELLSPALFLPAAERYQLMPMLDRWVIRNTFQCLGAQWELMKSSGAVFCINLSGQSLTNNGFLAFIADELEASGVYPNRICFEITETAAISNVDEATIFMGTLQNIGCRFALDDFGAGLSSFGYLKVLPVDYLKIDGSFVREVTSDPVSHSMVSAICQIGRTMGLSMIAEYVGDQQTVDTLRTIGIDYGQGFHIGKPVPMQEIIDRLQSGANAESA